jgi:hypothetical protein
MVAMATTPTPVDRGALVRRVVPKLALSIVAPLVVYLLVRPHVPSETVALAIGMAIPVLVTLAQFVLRRELDPTGCIAVLGFGIALSLAVLSGGDPLVLKLHDSVVTGPLGVLCLLSVAVGRPVLGLVKRAVVRRKGGGTTQRVDAAAERRGLSALTAVVGGTLVIHAGLILGLALTMPTATFLAVGRPIGWVVIAAGAATTLWLSGRLRTGRAARRAA